jgi:hypothetical protein
MQAMFRPYCKHVTQDQSPFSQVRMLVQHQIKYRVVDIPGCPDILLPAECRRPRSPMARTSEYEAMHYLLEVRTCVELCVLREDSYHVPMQQNPCQR